MDRRAWFMFTGSFVSIDTDGDNIISESEVFKYQQVYGGNTTTNSLDFNADNIVDGRDWFVFTGSLFPLILCVYDMPSANKVVGWLPLQVH